MSGFVDYFRWSWSWWSSPPPAAGPALTYLKVSATPSLSSDISAVASLESVVSSAP